MSADVYAQSIVDLVTAGSLTPEDAGRMLAAYRAANSRGKTARVTVDGMVGNVHHVYQAGLADAAGMRPQLAAMVDPTRSLADDILVNAATVAWSGPGNAADGSRMSADYRDELSGFSFRISAPTEGASAEGFTITVKRNAGAGVVVVAADTVGATEPGKKAPAKSAKAAE